MTHTVTIGGLLSVIGLIVGLCLTGGGGLVIFAGGMSDAPAAGQAVSKEGCVVALAGFVITALSIWGLLT